MAFIIVVLGLGAPFGAALEEILAPWSGLVERVLVAALVPRCEVMVIPLRARSEGAVCPRRWGGIIDDSWSDASDQHALPGGRAG